RQKRGNLRGQVAGRIERVAGGRQIQVNPVLCVCIGHSGTAWSSGQCLGIRTETALTRVRRTRRVGDLVASPNGGLAVPTPFGRQRKSKRRPEIAPDGWIGALTRIWRTRSDELQICRRGVRPRIHPPSEVAAGNTESSPASANETHRRSVVE